MAFTQAGLRSHLHLCIWQMNLSKGTSIASASFCCFSYRKVWESTRLKPKTKKEATLFVLSFRKCRSSKRSNFNISRCMFVMFVWSLSSQAFCSRTGHGCKQEWVWMSVILSFLSRTHPVILPRRLSTLSLTLSIRLVLSHHSCHISGRATWGDVILSDSCAV